MTNVDSAANRPGGALVAVGAFHCGRRGFFVEFRSGQTAGIRQGASVVPGRPDRLGRNARNTVFARARRLTGDFRESGRAPDHDDAGARLVETQSFSWTCSPA
jgi:hypothetical protein